MAAASPAQGRCALASLPREPCATPANVAGAGFIGFDNEAQCEEAYFKMNNVLIDDRRIKVDFSQSVAHLWKQFRK